MDNYAFFDFYQRLIVVIAEGSESSKYNRLCKGAFKDYEGTENCAHNMARSFLQTKTHLEVDIGLKRNDWLYRNIHVNEYSN